MRHRRTTAATGLLTVALSTITGCADRPNDLNTYYQDTPTSSTSRPPEPTPRPARAPLEVASADALSHTIESALLSAADVAGEGVHANPAPEPVSGCLAEQGGPAELHRTSTWEYPSGSVLDQQVAGYPSGSAGQALAAMRCPGAPLELPPAPNTQQQRAWCMAGTCTVVLTAAQASSGLQVSAGSDRRAEDAIRRLAPVAAAKLPDAQP